MATENLENKPFAGNHNEEEGDLLNLADIWSMIWDNKWWYALSVAVCLFFAAVYLYRTAPTYSRSAKVIVDDSNENSALRDLASFTGGISRYRAATGGSNVYNEMEAFSSPDLMSCVVRRLGLETTYREKQFLRSREKFADSPIALVQAGDNNVSAYSFEITRTGDSTFVIKDFRVAGEDIEYKEKISGTLRDTLTTPVGRLAVVPTMMYSEWHKPMVVSWVNAKRLAKSYCQRLSVSLSGKESTVLVLAFKDLFPSRADAVLRTLIDIYNEQWVENKNKSARNTTSFINDRLVVIEKELGGVEENLKDYKASHKITDIQSLSAAYLEESSQYKAKSFDVNNQLSIAKFIKEYLDNPVHSGALIPANSGLSSTTVESQIKEYNQAVLNRDRLMNESSNDNPLVSDLNQTISALKIAINRSIDNLISTLQLQADKVSAEENDIMSRIANTSGQELQLLSIERQQKIKEELYIYLLQKREENEIASLVNVGNTRLVMTPTGNDRPDSPNNKMVLLVALVLGMGIPFGIFFLLKQLDTRVKNRQDVTALQLPFLAEIPQIGQGAGLMNRLHKKMCDKANSRIVVEPANRDGINEAFRVLRTNLDFMTGTATGCRKVMVTSFNPNAGKTFVVINMAATMALKGCKVLLLDLDLRKATLSKALDRNKAGISAYLNGKVDNIKSEIQNVRDGLDLLSVGSLPPNPAEMLVSDRFTRMIEELSSNYDYIFMDCPPVEIVADTSIIAKSADYTVFVIRAGLFDKRALPAVEEAYEKGVYNRMALILNGVDFQAGGYGHYGYGGYGYGYGYGYGNQSKAEEKQS